MKRLLRRLLLALLLGAAALYPLYLIAGNLYLRSGDLERRLNRRPERLLIQVDSAWTPWPGVVHVRGFRLRNQTRIVQWWLSIDRATFTLQVFNLKQRELLIDDLAGSGVDVRLRRRVDVDRWVRKPQPELQPSIPGLANPPNPPGNPPGNPPETTQPPAPAGPPRDPWRIRLTGVHLRDVREIWIDEIHFSGDASLAGGFDLALRERLRVEPTGLRIASGTFALGGGRAARPILARAHGQIDAEISPYSPAEHRGWESARFLSGRIRLDGTVPDLRFLDHYIQRTRWLALDAPGSEVSADLRLRRGRLLPGSRMNLDPRRLAARALDYRAEGPGKIVWEVMPDGEGHLGLDFQSFQVTRGGYPQPHVRGERLRIDARTDPPRLEGLDPFRPRRFEITMLNAVVPNLGFYNAYLPPKAPLELTGGSGTMSARLGAAAPDWIGRGDLRLEARGVSARLDGRPLQGDILLRTHLKGADFRGQRFDLSGTRLDVTQVRIAGVEGTAGGTGGTGGTGAGWWARAHLDKAILEPGSPVLLRAHVESTLADPRPIFAFAAPPERRGRLLNWVDRLLDIQGVGAVADVTVGTQGVSLTDMAITGGPAEILGRLRVGGSRPQGLLYVRYGRFDVGLDMAGGQRDWKILKPREWFDSRIRLGS